MPAVHDSPALLSSAPSLAMPRRRLPHGPRRWRRGRGIRAKSDIGALTITCEDPCVPLKPTAKLWPDLIAKSAAIRRRSGLDDRAARSSSLAPAVPRLRNCLSLLGTADRQWQRLLS